MEYKSECKICGKCFEWKKNHKNHVRKYCSKNCAYEVLRNRNESQFRWDDLSEEEKLVKMKDNLEERLIKKDCCWEWKGGKDKDGYGQMQISTGNKLTKAHRVSWMVYKGDIPKGIKVCHKCDNPPCCNPDHLFLGTTKDNSADMTLKGRSTRGSKNATSKLKDDDIPKIRQLISLGVTLTRIAKDFGVSVSTICEISKGKRWRHIR
jgi:hypothetical protein